ncbi:MAG: endonuclease [Bacteroidia bacterium]|nr:endonuclease [Bacteroidia bacterium]
MRKLITAIFAVFATAAVAQTTLPTSWSFTTATYPNGWTASGTAFYTGSGNTPPACKLDGTGDYVEIWFASAPGPLSYYIAGNSFAGGTFEVQESVNGTVWTTMRTFTTNLPSATYTQFTDNPQSASRYVRFFYTQKVSGNVGLDDVNLAAAAAGPQQEIDCFYSSSPVITGGNIWVSGPVSTNTSFQIDVENNGTANTLNISSAVITGTNAADFTVNSFPATVAANGTAPVAITFNPSAAGTRTATLTINSDDADEPAYVININGAAGGFATEPASPATNLTFTNVKSYRFQVNFTAAAGSPDGYIVLRRDDAAVTDAPADGQVYMIGDMIGSSKVAYVGTGTSFWANFVGASQDYFFAVFPYNGPGAFRNYLTANPLNGSVTAAGSMQPSNYYNGINTASATFVTDLTALTNPHTDKFYSNYGPYMVSLFWARDTSGGQRVVTCVYSGEQFMYTEPFAWTMFSREHTYCHSWMPTYPSSNGPEYSDYFNLYPANQNDANAIRSNYPLGEVVNVNYTYLGCKYGTDINGRTVFEPRDEQKGDAARSLFYMATCYNTANQNWGFPNPISTSIMYGQDQDLLKRWHYQDLPDAREIAKNDFLDSLQGNRNPFIDSANYACYIDFDNMSWIGTPQLPCNTVSVFETPANTNAVSVYPNPGSGQFNLVYNTSVAEVVTVEVLDVTGRAVYSQQSAVATGQNVLILDLSGLAAGTYSIRTTGDAVSTVPLIIE